MLEKHLRLTQKIGLRLPHLLLVGGSAEDRAALAINLSRLVGATCCMVCSNEIARPCDMAAHLIELDQNILFLNEIDKLKPGPQEMLHHAISEGFVPIILEEWGKLRNKDIELTPFTTIAGVASEDLVTETLAGLFQQKLYLF